jgi:hypothetical protein
LIVCCLQQGQKGKKGQKQSSSGNPSILQQSRTPEERFKMKQDAQAQGKQEPDAAFQQRLEALKRSAKSRPQVIILLPTQCALTQAPLAFALVRRQLCRPALYITVQTSAIAHKAVRALRVALRSAWRRSVCDEVSDFSRKPVLRSRR